MSDYRGLTVILNSNGKSLHDFPEFSFFSNRKESSFIESEISFNFENFEKLADKNIKLLTDEQSVAFYSILELTNCKKVIKYAI